jgi:hypothetical protein
LIRRGRPKETDGKRKEAEAEEDRNAQTQETASSRSSQEKAALIA